MASQSTQADSFVINLLDQTFKGLGSKLSGKKVSELTAKERQLIQLGADIVS